MNRFVVLPVVIEKDSAGYFAFCPGLQGCYTQGNTYEEALQNIEDAVRLHIEDRFASGEPPALGFALDLLDSPGSFHDRQGDRQ